MGTIRHVVGQAWQQFGAQALDVLPHLLAALFVLLIGLLLGLVVSRLANRALAGSRLDRYAARLGLTGPLESLGISNIVRALATALRWAILLVALMVSLYSLDARLASDLAERLFLYLPHLGVALVILGAGATVARFVSRSVLIAAVNSEVKAAPLLAVVTKAAVMLLAGAIAAEHLGIGRVTVLTAFAIMFGGVTLAISMAVGLAAQEIVRRWLAEQMDRERPEPGGDTIHHW